MNSIPYLNLISGSQERRRAAVLNPHSLKRTLKLNLLHVMPSVCTPKPFLKSIYTYGGLFHAFSEKFRSNSYSLISALVLPWRGPATSHIFTGLQHFSCYVGFGMNYISGSRNHNSI